MNQAEFNQFVRQYADMEGARCVSLEWRGDNVYLEFDRPEQERICVVLENYAAMDKMTLWWWVQGQIHPERTKTVAMDVAQEPDFTPPVEEKPKKKSKK